MIRDYQGHTEQAKKHFLALRDGNDRNVDRLDSWQYIKSFSAKFPRLFWERSLGLRLGIEAAQTDGLILEFVVGSGNSIRQLSQLTDQDIHGFDSFQGLPEAWNHLSKGAFTSNGVAPEVPNNVHLHVGLFEESLPPFLKKYEYPIRLLSIDCDLYNSTKTVFDLLGDRIVSGTVIIFDEYLGYKSWREHEFKAFQEAVEKFGWQYDYLAVSLTDAEWAHIEPLIPPGKPGGGKRRVAIREVINGVMYILSTGCQWRALPKDLPPRSTVHDYLGLWNWDGTLDRIHHALYLKCREKAAREASPTACIIDSQSVKSAEKGGLASTATASMPAS